MLRRFLLPLLGVACLATEAASAQNLPASAAAAKPTASTYTHPVARPRALTAREKRAAAAAAKAARLATPALAVADASASAWSGWSNEPVSQAQEVGNGQHRPTMNVSVAPGMPLNQIGHGVSTDYNGRPLYRTETSTTLAPSR